MVFHICLTTQRVLGEEERWSKCTGGQLLGIGQQFVQMLRGPAERVGRRRCSSTGDQQRDHESRD